MGDLDQFYSRLKIPEFATSRLRCLQSIGRKLHHAAVVRCFHFGVQRGRAGQASAGSPDIKSGKEAAFDAFWALFSDSPSNWVHCRKPRPDSLDLSRE
jgi:hypothetical protein